MPIELELKVIQDVVDSTQLPLNQIVVISRDLNVLKSFMSLLIEACLGIKENMQPETNQFP